MISIIIPIYNGEKYLRRCIDSVLVQSFNDFELILVDDGSSDNSYNICYEYTRKDSRVKVLSQINSGVSEARNNGIQYARGEYITFIDCDDWIDGDYLLVLYSNLIDYNVDLSVIGYKDVREINEVSRDTQIVGQSNLISAEQMLLRLFKPIDFFCLCYPWAKLFKRDIIVDNNIRFDKSIVIGEDRLFLFEYLQHSQKVYYTSDSHYNYLCNSEGAMNMLKRTPVDVRYISCVDALDKIIKATNCKDVLFLATNEKARILIKVKSVIERKTCNISFIDNLNTRILHMLIHPHCLNMKMWVKLLYAWL